MSNKLVTEFKVFTEQPRNTKALLKTNMLYALVLPIVEVFVGAYIMRNTNSPAMVAIYQLAMYCGIIFTSFINGFLLKFMKVRYIYSAGMLISGISLLWMMCIKSISLSELGISGFVLGASSGFFWTNRYLLTLHATEDNNRNYFFGLESFAFTVASIIVPVCVGAVISGLSGSNICGIVFDVQRSYIVVTICAIIIASCACITLSEGKFENPVEKDFIYFKYDKLWYKMLLLSALKGLVQGFLVTAPAILVLKLVGEEGSLGLIQSLGGGLTAVLVYILGRTTKPKHRIIVFSFGLIIFFIGTLVNGLLFSFVGVIIFVLCKVIFQPLHDLAYYPIMMKTIDIVSKKEHRNEYAYILSHEFGMFVGRATGLILFIVLAYYISEDFSLKYALIIVGAVQMLSIPLAKHITKQSAEADTTEHSI